MYVDTEGGRRNAGTGARLSATVGPLLAPLTVGAPGDLEQGWRRQQLARVDGRVGRRHRERSRVVQPGRAATRTARRLREGQEGGSEQRQGIYPTEVHTAQIQTYRQSRRILINTEGRLCVSSTTLNAILFHPGSHQTGALTTNDSQRERQ